MTEQELFNTPVPAKTSSYTPVSHEHIVNEIRENIDKSGLSITGANYQIARKGEMVIGYMDLSADSDTFSYRLAFQNSYNKVLPVAFVGGTSVMICSNGMIIGETQFIRKHTGAVAQELSKKIQMVIEELETDLQKAERHAEQMKLIELNPTATAELCGRLLMEHEILSSSQLSIIRQQLRKPDHVEFADANLWSLYNHATHALKSTHPHNYLDSYSRLHDFVEAEYQLQ